MQMKQIRYLLSVFLIAALLLAPTGCAFLTARRVAMAGGKAVGKKLYEKHEDAKAKKEQASNEQIAAQDGHEDVKH